MPKSQVVTTVPAVLPNAQARNNGSSLEEHVEQYKKKMVKRAANRKSAQLSRKRKKAFIDELRSENQVLRRYQHILESIPDLVFSFDAKSGCFCFVSKSVSNYLQIPVSRLLETSVYQLVTGGSGKNLKKILQKTLEGKSDEEERCDLPKRLELCFQTKYMTKIWGEVDGVIHFGSKDKVECVCTFRPSIRKSKLGTDVTAGESSGQSSGQTDPDNSAGSDDADADSGSSPTNGSTTGSCDEVYSNSSGQQTEV